MKLGALIADQWNGRLSLPWSLFGVGILQAVALKLIAICILNAFSTRWVLANGAAATLSVTFAYNAFALPIFIWWIVGTLRSARVSWSTAKNTVLTVFAVLIVGVLAAAEAYSLVTEGVPQAIDAAEALLGDPEWGRPTVSVTSNGTKLQVHGAMSDGLLQQVERSVASHARIRVVELDSIGGRAAIGRELRDFIRMRRLDTLVTQECDSACTVAFLGGTRRTVTESARMGFHAFSYVGSDNQSAVTDAVISDAVAMGVKISFLNEAYNYDSGELWFPSSVELKDAGFVTDVVDSHGTRTQKF